MITVSPHEFQPLRFWDRFREYGRCRKCMMAKSVHPIRYWAPGRPLKDKSKAKIMYISY